jgi:uncharacterized protein YbjT (DUF2867 family)
MKTAIVIGATGLVGKSLVEQLLGDERYEKVVVLVRRSTGLKSGKLEEHLINFDKPNDWKHLVKGDVLFSALGTTLKQAGGKEQQYRIDYTYQYQTAKAAAEHGVPVYVLVSASGADPKSRIFYSRMKGELDRDVQALGFRCVVLIKPSLLVGHRNHERTGEKIGYRVLKLINSLGILKKYQPVEGRVVAAAMIKAAQAAQPGVTTYELDQIHRLVAP